MVGLFIRIHTYMSFPLSLFFYPSGGAVGRLNICVESPFSSSNCCILLSYIGSAQTIIHCRAVTLVISDQSRILLYTLVEIPQLCYLYVCVPPWMWSCSPFVMLTFYQDSLIPFLRFTCLPTLHPGSSFCCLRQLDLHSPFLLLEEKIIIY